METQQLEFVLAVMKTGSFTQAAKRGASQVGKTSHMP